MRLVKYEILAKTLSDLRPALTLFSLLLLVPAAASAATLTAVTVTPATSTLTAGHASPFQATATYGDGSTQDVSEIADWTTSSTSVAIVSTTPGSRGLVIAVSPGSVTISAAVQQNGRVVRGNAKLTVLQAPIVSLSTRPTSKRLTVGTTVQFSAKAVFENGSEGDVTRSVNWSSSNPGIATVGNSGAAKGSVHAVAKGKTLIRVKDPVSGVINTDADGTTQVAATITGVTIDQQNITLGRRLRFPIRVFANRADGTRSNITSRVTFSTSPAGIVRVSTTTGGQTQIVGVANGTAAVSATDPTTGLSTQSSGGNATVTVAGDLVTLHVKPNPMRVEMGAVRNAHAFGQLSSGAETSDLAKIVTWSIDNTAIAKVGNTDSDHGAVTGIKPGTVTLRATETVTGVRSGEVGNLQVRGKLVSFEVLPVDGLIPLGEQLLYKARATFSDGTQSNIGEQCKWSVSNPHLASVDNDTNKGTVTGLSVGSTNVQANCSGVVETAPVQVIGHLTDIVVKPDPFKAAAFTDRKFNATGLYDDGSQKKLTKLVQWSSTDPSVVVVDNDKDPGQARTLSPGTAQIVAKMNGFVGTSDVTVQAALVGLEIDPSDVTLRGSTGVRLQAKGLLSDGTTESLSSKVLWFTDNPAVARVSNVDGEQGLVIGGGVEGTTTITAVANPDLPTSMSATAQVTVAGLLTALHMSPDQATVAVHSTLQANAKADFTDGATNRIVTKFVVFQSSNPSVALVANEPGAHGLVTAVSPGTAQITAVDPSTGIVSDNSLTVRVPR
jgi:hypothetical protein